MSREIKFRAWDFALDEMLDWSYILNNLVGNYEDVFNDKRFIMMQYTGLKDKNGVKIYERDIIQFDFGKDSKEGVVNSLVAFSQGMYCYRASQSKQVIRGNKWKQPHDYVRSNWWGWEDYPLHEGFYGEGTIEETDYTKSNITVIGNIYQNKNLL